MNIILENIIENDLIKCYDKLDITNSFISKAYSDHNIQETIKNEITLINLMKNIENISTLRKINLKN